jgi:hypothetical protein
MMVHLQHAFPARRAVMGAIWFPRLAFLAISEFAIRFDCEIRRNGWRMCREGAVVVFRVRCRTWTREDRGGVRPV